MNCPKNKEIVKAFLTTEEKLKDYKNIMLTTSGGADSDIMLDMVYRNLPPNINIHYVFFDTGLEFQASKDHLKELEEKYNIKIEIEKPYKPIPVCCKEYGQPFLSKFISDYISRLQRHNFKWEDRPFEELYKEYPHCKSALKWWCNYQPGRKDGSQSKFGIGYYPYLKEYMVLNPPTFKISDKCCQYSKKEAAKNYHKKYNIDLTMTGVRKAEKGQRADAHKSCFSRHDKGKPDEYRPLFWFKKQDKIDYDEFFEIKHNRCYTVYGMDRTGCGGCPFGKDFEEELLIMKKFEPKLKKAAEHIFKESYEYTRGYREFRKGRTEEDKQKNEE
jgi:3'-phosphoadenosine 5'-phosphosulfate sulfotransferase (PAPS reductase)/FAD synthetase